MPSISKLPFCKEKKLIEKFLLCHNVVFRYLGLHLEENDSGITLDQMNYSENLNPTASNCDESIYCNRK